MRIHQLRCFGAFPGTGNVAMVIEDGPATPAARQAFAAAQDCSACVFLGPGDIAEADYYYPHTRSPLCLHATLAAAHVLLARGAPPLLVTAMHGQRVRLLGTDAGCFAGVQRQAVPSVLADADCVAWLLGTDAAALAWAPVVASVGSPKLLIALRERSALATLAPPLARIVEWGKAHGINGCYVVCQIGEDTYEGRNFNHLDPAREDPATGVAAGALSAVLGRPLTVFQGAALGTPCRIVTRIEGETVFVGGATELIIG